VQNACRSYPIVEGYLGIAQGLADDGILYRPQLPTGSSLALVPYNIMDWALSYLLRHPQLESLKRWLQRTEAPRLRKKRKARPVAG